MPTNLLRQYADAQESTFSSDKEIIEHLVDNVLENLGDEAMELVCMFIYSPIHMQTNDNQMSHEPIL